LRFYKFFSQFWNLQVKSAQIRNTMQ
jgi:hypothetical protein